MSAVFLDLDGTIFEHGTNDLLEGAEDLLIKIRDSGSQLIFTTRRGDEFAGHEVYSKEPTLIAIRDLVESLNIDDYHILFNISSPRIVINDDGAFAIDHRTNSPWTDGEIGCVLT